MTLREVNATRTRQHIIESAMELFTHQGYDDTTMEDVARRADVSPSTLYRYFPAKEELAIAPVGDPRVMADELRRREPGEPIDLALGHAIVAMLKQLGHEGTISPQFRKVIESNARPRARLLEFADEVQNHLCLAIAEREGLPDDDLTVVTHAWLAFLIFKRLDATPGAAGSTASLDSVAKDIMEQLGTVPFRPPRL